jgi:hypothetical protein
MSSSNENENENLIIINNNYLNINNDLNDYLWDNIISYDVLEDKYKKQLIENRKTRKKSTNREFLELDDKIYLKHECESIDEALSNIYLNEKIVTDHKRGWEFFFNKKIFMSVRLDIKKYKNDKTFIDDFDKELNILTADEGIRKKIKITSYQVIMAEILQRLVNYFNISTLNNMNITLFLKFKEDIKKKVIVKISNIDNNIITNISSYFTLIFFDLVTDISYDLCKIDFECLINFTKNTIDVKYKLNYKNVIYRNIVTKLPKKYFKQSKLYFNRNVQNKNSNNLLFLIYELLFNDNINQEIRKQTIFYNYIYKLLKNIKDDESSKNFVKTIKFLHKYCNLISNKIIRKNNKDILNKSIGTTIPVTKNIKDKVRSDFLIVSYNEEAKKFRYNDCLPIIFKILDENPFFIFICTQESKSGNFTDISNALHYQHVLDIYITELGYKKLTKIDASVIGIKDKNVRTRIYIKKKNVEYDKLKKLRGNLKKKSLINNNSKNKITNIIEEDNSYILDENKTKYISDENKYLITSFGSKKSVDSGLGSDTGIGLKKVFTLFKGSIFARLEFTKNINGITKNYKIIVVNSHLYYKKSGDTGLKEREKELSDIIKEFKLIEFWNKGYNIFFCGDMNFRLNNVNDKNKTNEGYESIISTYLLNTSKYKEESSEKLKLKNELYGYILKHNEDEVDKSFYTSLGNSIDKLGIHLSSKYFEGKSLEDIKFFKDKNISSHKEIFNIYPKKNGKNINPRVPSQTDRIIFALSNENSNIKINPYNFNVHLFPDKSDHKMITLSFELCDE